MDWQAGNWFTMGNPDTYPARLVGTVFGAPTGSTITLEFPPGSPLLQRTVIVEADNPANPTCLGRPVAINEPFVIPPEPEIVGFTLALTEECSDLREGTVARFQGQAVADVPADIPRGRPHGLEGVDLVVLISQHADEHPGLAQVRGGRDARYAHHRREPRVSKLLGQNAAYFLAQYGVHALYAAAHGQDLSATHRVGL